MNVKIKAKTTTLRIAVFTTAVLLLFITASTGSAATITVNDSGGADYTTIQAAVNNASGGDVIQVAAGTYYEHVVVNRSVALQGESNSTTIIYGSGYGNVTEVTVDGVMIDGFTIQNGSSGIYVTSSNNVFSNNSITNIVGANGVSGGDGGIGCGLYLLGSTNNTLTSNTISSIAGGTGGEGVHEVRGGGGGIGCGIYLSSSTDNSLTSNTITNITGGTGGTGGFYDGDDQVSYGVYLETDSYQNIISSNTMEGDPIIYYYGVNGIVIENYVLAADSNPTNLGKIVLINSSNIIIQNNIINNFIGETGGMSYYGDSGEIGGIGSGIYLSNSTNNTLTSNTISNITGGNGGMGRGEGSSGVGGLGCGIYFSDSTNNTLTSNTISNITGGNGGEGDYGVRGGAGGGIYLSSSTNNTLTSNTISNITGGTGSMPGGLCWGGAGGIGSGIYLSGSTNNTLTSNTISNISGGTGGEGEYGVRGGAGGGIYLSDSINNTLTFNTISNIAGGSGGRGQYGAYGGAGGLGAGIYLSGSTNNTLTSNTISNVTGGTSGTDENAGSGSGGAGTGIYFSYSTNNTITSNIISNITGGTGGGGMCYGCGAGGLGSGINLSSSTYNTLTSNTISNITGGTGGVRIDLSSSGSNGAGGLSCGLYLSGSTYNTLTSNTISNIIGGTGGIGGDYGSDGPDGTGYGIYLYTSTLNLLFHNNLQNEDKNGYDNGSNSWDNGYPSGGNYWSDYTGVDLYHGPDQNLTGSDGIGDLPYNNISGSAGAQDRYPLMQPWNLYTMPPTVTGNEPTGTDVTVSTQIQVTFSEAMDQASAESAFSTSPVTTGNFSWNGNIMTYIPDLDLTFDTTYTVTVGTGAKDLADNNMLVEHTWDFTTEVTSNNIIQNPGFESGTSPWRFYTNGIGTFLNDASGAGSPHAGHITISQEGSNVQLYQSGIVLEPNTLYRLSFKAYSNTGHDFSISLHEHGSPYTNYGLSNYVVDLGTSWSEYSTQFTTSGFSGTVNDGRLRFWLSPYDATGDQYFIDDIRLVEVDIQDTTPPTIIGNEPTGTDVPVSTQIQVTFSEAMDQASAESAFSTSSVTTGNFSWNSNIMTYIPDLDLASDTTYTVTVGTGAKDLADNNMLVEHTWDFTTEVTLNNIIQNPGFESGTSPWRFYTNGIGTFLNDASGDGSPHAGHITISQEGSNVQLYQPGLVLEPNTLYRLSFKAYSNTGHDFSISLHEHGSPYTNYGLSNYVVDLGTSWSEYSTQFTTSGFSGTVNDGRLRFWLSPYDAIGDQYFIDDVILVKV